MDLEKLLLLRTKEKEWQASNVLRIQNLQLLLEKTTTKFWNEFIPIGLFPFKVYLKSIECLLKWESRIFDDFHSFLRSLTLTVMDTSFDKMRRLKGFTSSNQGDSSKLWKRKLAKCLFLKFWLMNFYVWEKCTTKYKIMSSLSNVSLLKVKCTFYQKKKSISTSSQIKWKISLRFLMKRKNKTSS